MSPPPEEDADRHHGFTVLKGRDERAYRVVPADVAGATRAADVVEPSREEPLDPLRTAGTPVAEHAAAALAAVGAVAVPTARTRGRADGDGPEKKVCKRGREG
ncbi:hypothetical protein [Streptomyces sp.]|uniref:hypothetical protein n=1 Tax=Streptomyces sp. TaxID=1931 RepID=UPI002810A0E8|nr:hypothetical protein [Streptomyces sp.]